MQSLCQNFRPDIIHCNDVFALRAAVRINSKFRPAIVFTVRNTNMFDPPINPIWEDQLIEKIDYVTVLSSEMKATVEKTFVSQSLQVEEISSIVDLNRFCPVDEQRRRQIRKTLGIAENSFAVGFVGSFQPRKNQLAFLKDCAPRLMSEVPEMHIHFVGDFNPDTQPYDKQCEMEADAGLSERVTFHGPQSNVEEYYRAFDVVIVASEAEGMARCMIESLACGTPVVSFDVCSARENLDVTGAGRVVEQGDFATMANSIAALAHDHDTLREMSQAARRRAESKFDQAKVKPQWERLFAEAASAGET
ncbi:glycosyltransferase family 1 protein [Aurantiacibacter aquimixticola]|uniref:Glycosyltransferase family 1 protein n=2 Tax=Aurantiacibacter aquimixticola TaxID=1958945 RepID=A0A419RSK6_9SPHN|nr:glycosyltransferase family 1 protein [Aurantiacibacter aquimixticola]